MEETPIPAIPTLHNYSVPVLTKLPDQCLHLILFFFANPGRTSSINESEMISFRDLNSRYGNDPVKMCEACASAIRGAVNRFAPGANVECTYEKDMHKDQDGVLQGTYKMTIEITDSNGAVILDRKSIVITEDGDRIDAKFIQ
jgi:hypothetical protein